jgi:MATE family multidrug resistance protein
MVLDDRPPSTTANRSTPKDLAIDDVLCPPGDTGVWLALLISDGFRAGTLALWRPALCGRVASAALP